MAKKRRINIETPAPCSEAATLGARLRLAREKACLSVEEVHSRTRIPLASITALEDDDFSSLPASVYVKGFIKLFCREVGLDYTETVALMPEAAAAPMAIDHRMSSIVTPAIGAVRDDENNKEERESRVSTALLVFIVFVLVTLAVSYFVSQRESEDVVSPSASEIANVDLTG